VAFSLRKDHFEDTQQGRACFGYALVALVSP
jgi:hypothetical protein